jgi:hypothetical protein
MTLTLHMISSIFTLCACKYFYYQCVNKSNVPLLHFGTPLILIFD